MTELPVPAEGDTFTGSEYPGTVKGGNKLFGQAGGRRRRRTRRRRTGKRNGNMNKMNRRTNRKQSRRR